VPDHPSPICGQSSRGFSESFRVRCGFLQKVAATSPLDQIGTCPLDLALIRVPQSPSTFRPVTPCCTRRTHTPFFPQRASSHTKHLLRRLRNLSWIHPCRNVVSIFSASPSDSVMSRKALFRSPPPTFSLPLSIPCKRSGFFRCRMGDSTPSVVNHSFPSFPSPTPSRTVELLEVNCQILRSPPSPLCSRPPGFNPSFS